MSSPVRRGSPTPRRRRAAWLVPCVAAVLAGCAGERPGPAVAPPGSATPDTAHSGPVDDGPPVPSASPDDRTDPVARRGGVELVVPSRYAILVGFHEGGSTALELDVVGAVTADHAGAGVRTIGPADPGPDEATVIVLPGRHRDTAPTTAMDVVVPPDRPIVSPLDGTVTAVDDYLLYGRQPDVRVVVSPHADDTVRAVLLHLEDVAVAVGDELRAGETVVAERARALSEPSQIDRYTRRSASEDAPPHVHLELRPSG